MSITDSRSAMAGERVAEGIVEARARHLAAIEAHMAHHFGPADSVLHEIISDLAPH